MIENDLREVWKLCAECRQTTPVTHWVWVDGELVHDPDSAFLLAAGLVAEGEQPE